MVNDTIATYTAFSLLNSLLVMDYNGFNEKYGDKESVIMGVDVNQDNQDEIEDDNSN